MSEMPFSLMVSITAALAALLVVAFRVMAARRERDRAARLHAAASRASMRSRTNFLGPAARTDRDQQSVHGPDRGIEVCELGSAVELAKLLLGTGQTHDAARVLTNFIEDHPRQAIAPWLKLLEIYGQAGARSEYETIARGLREHFNMRAPAWGEDARSDAGIEAHSHVIDEIVHRWGSHACRHYLGRLVVDNRGGSRNGFSAAAMSDILFLTEVLETILDASHGPAAEGIRRPAILRGTSAAEAGADKPCGFVVAPSSMPAS